MLKKCLLLMTNLWNTKRTTRNSYLGQVGLCVSRTKEIEISYPPRFRRWLVIFREKFVKFSSNLLVSLRLSDLENRIGNYSEVKSSRWNYIFHFSLKFHTSNCEMIFCVANFRWKMLIPVFTKIHQKKYKKCEKKWIVFLLTLWIICNVMKTSE